MNGQQQNASRNGIRADSRNAGMNSRNKRRRRKSRRRNSYIALTAVVALFALLIIAAFAAVMLLRGGDTPEGVGSPPASPLPPAQNVSASLGPIGYGDVFFVKTEAELSSLAELGALSSYFESKGKAPVVILADGIIFESDVIIPTAVDMLFLGDADMKNGARIIIKTDAECGISLTTNENLLSFYIDAPRASLAWRGGDVPFSYEVAMYMNVASFNGSEPAYEGDRLGGEGKREISGVKLYKDKNKKTEADGECTVIGNVITVYYPYDFGYGNVDKAYIDLVTADGGTYEIKGAVDLDSQRLITVTDGDGKERVYRLNAERRSYGIPILSIDTASGKDIASKTVYERATMTLDGETYAMNVRGRGNASWRIFPKHAYRLKLDEKASVLGLDSNRDWVLVSNYADPSLIRNCVASDMAKTLDGLGFTPTHKAVDLYVNGKYQGIYMIAEKIEDAGDRVDLGDPIYGDDGKLEDFGFLLEFGWDYDSENVYGKDYFNTTYCKRVYVKEPEITEAKNSTYKYIYNYITAVDKAISEGGDWQSLIDVDSWVDWFIVNELTNNTECVFYRSLYMYKPAGGKLTAGPIWDYDMAFGNHLDDIKDYEGWVSVDSTYGYLYKNWMYYLLRDEYFVSLVKARWEEKKEVLLKTALDSVDANAAVIKNAQKNNFAVWPKVLKYQIGVSTASTLVHTWEGHLDYIRDFVNMRYQWMDERLTREGSILD